ncbi:MAG: hypothetical protein JXR35_03985 [Rhodobacteraceae bacterium]|nr:hypothetical protein [Paracoccaceae bacterium]
MTHPLPSLVGLALNFETGSAPDWVQLIPAGPQVVGRDGRAWAMPDAQAVADRFDPAKEPQIDLEHSSQLLAPNGMPAPAVGWVKQLEVREGAIWGRVEWNAEGAAAITSRAYRYLSPVFTFSKGSHEIQRIVSVGLTNSPNLEMAALNSAEQKETAEMVDPTILEALGLKPTADTAAAVLAINAMKDEHQTALNSVKAGPDPEKFIPIADHQLALNRIAEFEEGEKTRAETEIGEAVDAAIAAGKIAPSSKDFHLAACRAEGGLERFQAFIGAAPVIAGKSDLDTKKPGAVLTALNAEEKAAALALGISEEDYATAKQE